MTARAIMVLGTSSHVGKSMLTTALCRILHRAGYSVAPFKSQNMSLNSAATPEGLEIGRAQALQAEAAGIVPSVHMNPILLKPTGNAASQVIVRGRIWQHLDASNYHQHRVLSLLPVVEESYATLAAQHNVIVLEGAGSPAEINLKETDIANMRMAAVAQAPCLLVGDIDRGGVFASLLGTMELLDPEEQQRIRGFVINKFRGDRQLLTSGIEMIERRIGRPCMGVLPFLPSLALDQEDSVGLEHAQEQPWSAEGGSARRLRIAVITLPSLSNFTDFDALRAEPSVAFRYVRNPQELAAVDVIILPGSKQTVDDLRWLKHHRFDTVLQAAADRGAWIIGICGGFQMLGGEILDPQGLEGSSGEQGLNMLPIRTTLDLEKITVSARGTIRQHELFGRTECAVHGYEIHLGQTEYLSGASSFADIRRGPSPERSLQDGCVSPSGRIFGTYLHGIFDGDSFRHLFLRSVRARAGLSAPEDLASWSACRQAQLDLLADEFGNALDLSGIFALLRLPQAGQAKSAAQ